MKQGLTTLISGLLAACGQRQPTTGGAQSTPSYFPGTSTPAAPPTERLAPTTAPPTAKPATPTRAPAAAQERWLPSDRAAEVHYVALGDSTVAGLGASRPELIYVSRLGARLRGVYPRTRVTNLGVSGATSADVVRGQLANAVALQPHLVTLSIGPNDITQGKDAAQYERNIATIFQTVQQQTEAVLVVNLLPDMTVAPRFGPREKASVGQQVQLFNEAVRRQSERFGVELVDLYTPSQQEVPDHVELVAGDNYHPSDAGYLRWAEIMWQGVERRLA